MSNHTEHISIPEAEWDALDFVIDMLDDAITHGDYEEDSIELMQAHLDSLRELQERLYL